MDQEFKEMLKGMCPVVPRRVGVIAAEDANVLKAVLAAYDMGFAESVLFGNKDKIKKIADTYSIDISKFEIVNANDYLEAAAMAVAAVRSGRVDTLMKGLIHTADVLRAVLNRENGIRDDGFLSQVSVMHSIAKNQTLFLTDCVMVPYPDLQQKVELINNAVQCAKCFGIKVPKVAPLAAIEIINPKMPATVEAAELTRMNQIGLIRDCVVDGPMALDGAISVAAATKKGMKSSVAGQADVLLFHNIEAANAVMKSMVYFGGFIFGSVVMGARVPILLNSRSDTDVSKLFSIACAAKLNK